MRLCTGRTAHRGSRRIALVFLDNGTRRRWRVNVTPRPLFIPGKDPVSIAQEAGWAPGSVWTGTENFAPRGIRSPDRPARSQSLYRLSYPARSCEFGLQYFVHGLMKVFFTLAEICRLLQLLKNIRCVWKSICWFHVRGGIHFSSFSNLCQMFLTLRCRRLHNSDHMQ